MDWGVPADAYAYLLRNNLMPVLEELSAVHGIAAKRIALLYAHLLKHLQGSKDLPFDHQRMADLLLFVTKRKLREDILPDMVKVLFAHPNMQFASILAVLGYEEVKPLDIEQQIPQLIEMWPRVKTKGMKRPDACKAWIMGRLRKPALGNVALSELHGIVCRYLEKEGNHA